MRFVVVMGVGLGVSVLGACGSNDTEVSTRSSKTVPCRNDLDCNGGELCDQGLCISARVGAGGIGFGSGGSVASGGNAFENGGLVGSGGLLVGSGGFVGGGGL